MDVQMFTALAERAHIDAEANMRLHGRLAQMVLLYDRDAGLTFNIVRGDFGTQIYELRKIVRSTGAVAAIRIATGLSLPIPSGAVHLPPDDLPVPSESPDGRLLIVSEARWPQAGIHQVRTTRVECDAAQELLLTREHGDPDQAVLREDQLAKLFSR